MQGRVMLNINCVASVLLPAEIWCYTRRRCISSNVFQNCSLAMKSFFIGHLKISNLMFLIPVNNVTSNVR